MPHLPHRQSLASQMAAILRESIRQGLWSEWLPGERTLCDQYQVSRNTLRTALAQLQRDKLIRAEHGAGNRILSEPRQRPADAPSRDVGLLSPEPLERLRPTQTLWIDELRAMLSERGCRLHVFHGKQYFRATPGPALQRLIADSPHGCWILTLSNGAIQRWFAKHAVRCVVAGSVHAGLDLPYRDLDHRAMCRHAAGLMLGLGHRKLALIIAKSHLAGDLESEAGFVEGVSRSAHEGAGVSVCRHDGTVDGIGRSLGRLMEQEQRPTALLVVNPFHYLAVCSRLAQMGWQIPEQVSVLSRDEDPFLSFLVPAPARYVTTAHAFARALLRPVIELLGGDLLTEKQSRLIPKFMKGASLGRVPCERAKT